MSPDPNRLGTHQTDAILRKRTEDPLLHIYKCERWMPIVQVPLHVFPNLFHVLHLAKRYSMWALECDRLPYLRDCRHSSDEAERFSTTRAAHPGR